jgi:exodeoxyribonuclease V alpha subunit
MSVLPDLLIDPHESLPQAARNATALADGLAEHLGRWAVQAGAMASDIALLARAARELAWGACDGHVCLPLEGVAGASAEAARRVLLASGAAAESGLRTLSATAYPLVIDGERLYLRYFFDLETRLAAALTRLTRLGTTGLPAPAVTTGASRQIDFGISSQRLGHLVSTSTAAGQMDTEQAVFERLRLVLDSRFPAPSPVPDAPPKADWQKLAVALALTRRLTIISGGPGTGKTTTVAALIACLLELEPDLRIALAAPTGKAAARMREALAARAHDLPAAVRAHLPTEAHTVHRLLGVTPTPGRFRHHADNPLALDLLVVDEASMLDLALAASLVDALPAHARLVLLGDKDQLAAVEAGAVFADLSGGWRFGAEEAQQLAALSDIPAETLQHGSGTHAALADSVVWLTESHRFRADSGIGRLAREINAGEGSAALGWLRTNTDPAVRWIEDADIQEADAAPNAAPAVALAAMENGYAAYFAALREEPAGETPAARTARIFAAFDRFRVLVAVHAGPRGLAAINAHLSQHARAVLGLTGSGPFWAGQPLIVLKNDPVTRLFNGDVGLCLPDVDGALRVYFPTADGTYRALPPQRLPERDIAFALTVHKSQGSEFAEVLLLLPARPVRVLSRELLYTAVTRAAQRVTLAGSAPVFTAACAARTERFSGLGGRLRDLAAHSLSNAP